MYLYETHLHTSPVSKCARASVRETVEFYKSAGYAGIFITNHFLDGNIAADPEASYEERIRFYFADYEEGIRVGKEVGLSVFGGIETTYKGTDFLVYGLDKEWFLAHPEIMDMKKTVQLPYFMEAGALVIHAHPYREDSYIDHIRLFPRSVHGVEIYNANRKPLENDMAAHYADAYNLIPFAGSDNHQGGKQTRFGGMQSDTPIRDEADFVRRVLSGEMQPFRKEI